MIRGLRASVNWPSPAFTCAPFGSNRTAVSRDRNWVWLKALYASQRSWALKRSPIGRFLNREISQLLTPGPRKSILAALPKVPTAGNANTSVRKLRSKVRSLLGRTGLPVITTRADWVGVPVMSMEVVVVKETVVGAPLLKLAIPDSCQSLRTILAIPLVADVLGRSQTQFTLTTWVRSNEARP